MAKKEYEINIFDVKSIERFENDLNQLQDALKSKEFMQFLADKCMEELNSIIAKTSSESEYNPQMSEYRDSNKVEIGNDYVRIYNDSMVDLSHVSSRTLEHYTDGLSLAKLIEFGTGIPRNY